MLDDRNVNVRRNGELFVLEHFEKDTVNRLRIISYLADVEDKIDKEPKQAQKKAIRDKEDLEGKKKVLNNKEAESMAALKAKHLKEREIHVLQLQTVKGLIDSAKADQDQLKAYKAAVAAIKMPKAV